MRELSKPSVKIVAIVGEGSVSPLKSTPWAEVLQHTAKRLKWVDEGFCMLVLTDDSNSQTHQTTTNLQRELGSADFLLVVAVKNRNTVSLVRTHMKYIRNVVCFDSSPLLNNKLGGSYVFVEENFKFSKVMDMFQIEVTKDPVEVLHTVRKAWNRCTSDDIRFCLLVIIDAYIKPVKILKGWRVKDLSAINCMIMNCGTEIRNCLLDPMCARGLQCLMQCNPSDQVCNYQCIAAYESPKLEAISHCVLQKNNCLQLDAQIPDKLYVPPLSKFRGRQLSHETAEDLLIGWLGTSKWSWRVAAGINPAYDQFSCQFQLSYRGKAKGSFWHEPVFRMRTPEGKLVWRRRKYQVTRGDVAGKFHFSVSDNGVVSNEIWTVVDVADDLRWGLFHYGGAARAAGLAYSGAVLVTPDGEYPDMKERVQVMSAMEKCGIKEWEMDRVDNCSCLNPPLGYPQGSKLHSSINAISPHA